MHKHPPPLSDETSGKKDDKLASNFDQIAVASVDGVSFDLLLESIKDKDGGPIWLFS